MPFNDSHSKCVMYSIWYDANVYKVYNKKVRVNMSIVQLLDILSTLMLEVFVSCPPLHIWQLKKNIYQIQFSNFELKKCVKTKESKAQCLVKCFSKVGSSLWVFTIQLLKVVIAKKIKRCSNLSF